MLLCQVGQRKRHSLQTEVIVKVLCVLYRGSDGMASEVAGFAGRVASKGWRLGSLNRVIFSNADRCCNERLWLFNKNAANVGGSMRSWRSSLSDVLSLCSLTDVLSLCLLSIGLLTSGILNISFQNCYWYIT